MLGDGDPLVGRGETDPVQLAVHLGQDVGPGERGPTFSHRPHRHAGGVGQDLVGQVAGVEKWKVVAIRQSRHPRDLVVADVALGPSTPARGQLGQAVVFLGRPGLQGRPASQLEHFDTGRLAAMSGDELADQDCLALIDGGRALTELGHESLAHPGHLETGLLGVPACPTVPAPPQ